MTTTFKGANIYYEVHGDGPPLVFLHGFLEDLSVWKDVTEKLSPNNKVIAIDLLGHGKSGLVAEVHTMNLMAEAVQTVFVLEKINNAKIFGHSMGGYVALAFGELYPELVGGICLLNSTALEDSQQKKKDRERAVESVINNYPLFVSITIPNLFAEKNRDLFAVEISQLKSKALKIPVPNVVAAIRGMKTRPNRENILSKFKDQSLIILGKDDSLLAPEIQRRYLQSIGVDYCFLNGGHFSFIEQKSETYYKILHFIEK